MPPVLLFSRLSLRQIVKELFMRHESFDRKSRGVTYVIHVLRFPLMREFG